MAKVTVVKEKNYTTIDNGIFKDTRLSFKAKGLLTTMLSLPPTWNYTIEGLKSLSKDGKDSVKTALKELEDCGYLERKKIRNDNGSFCDLEYFVYEKPQTKEPQAENPPTDKSSTEKPTQLNTDELNINISNTDLLKTDKLNTDNNSFSKEKEESNSPKGNSNSFSSEKKSGRSPKQKKPLSEKELEQTNAKMPYRAKCIALNIAGNEDLASNVMKFFEYFLTERKKHTGAWHISLNDTTLAKVIATITEDIKVDRGDYDDIYFALVDDTGNDDYKEVIDKYFDTKFKNKVDYSLVHFTQDNVLVNIMNHCGKENWCMSGI